MPTLSWNCSRSSSSATAAVATSKPSTTAQPRTRRCKERMRAGRTNYCVTRGYAAASGRRMGARGAGDRDPPGDLAPGRLRLSPALHIISTARHPIGCSGIPRHRFTANWDRQTFKGDTMIGRRFAALGVLAALALAPQARGGDDGFIPMFNGKDLNGWVNVNCAPETFFVKDGMIITTGRPTGFLRTDRQYEHFILEFDWMHVQ